MLSAAEYMFDCKSYSGNPCYLQVYNDRSSESDMFCNYVIQRMNQRCKLDGSSDHSGILTYPTWSPAETNNSSLDLTPVAKQTGGSSQFPTAYAPISTAGSMIFDDVSSKTGAPLKLLSKSGGGAAGMTSSSSTHTNNNNSNLLCAPHHSLQQQMSMTTCPHFANNNNHGAGSQQTGFNTQRQQQANMAFNITGGYDNAKANNNSPVNSSGSTTTHQPDSSLTSPLLQLSSPVSPLSPSSTSTTSSTDSSSSAFPNDNGCVNHNIDQQQRSEAIANLQQQQQQLQSLAGDGTSVTSEDDDSGSGTTGNSRYKTEPCRPFEETGVCKYGEKCQFAHGPDELRPLPRHPKYKTEMCKTFHTVGICPYGYRCHFIHNEPLPGPHEQQQQQMMSSTTGGPSRFGTFGNAPGPGDVFVDPGYYGNSNPMSGPFGTWNEQQMQLRTPQQQASLQHQHVLRSASESRYPTSVNRHMAACNEHDGSTTLDWPIDAASAYKAGCYGMPHSADLANVMAVCNKGGGRGVDIRNNNNDTVYYNNHNMATHFHHNIHQHHQNCGGGAAVDLKMSMSSCGRSSSFGSHGSSSGGGGAPLGATGSSLGSHGDSPVPPPSSSDSPASFSPSTTGSEDGGDSGVFGVAAPVNFSLLLHQNQQLQQSCPHQLQRYPGSCECAAHLQAMACSCAGSGMMGPMGPQVFQFPSVNPYGGGAPCYNNGGLLPRSTTNQRGQSLDVCENERHWPERHRHPAQLQLQPTSPAVSAMSGSSVNCYNRVTGSLAKLGSANLVSLDVVATSLKHHMNTTKSSAAAASNCAAVEAAVVVDSLACDLGRGLSNMQILDSTATSGHDANIDASVRSLPPGSRFGGPTFSPPAAHVGWSQGPNDEAGRSMLQTGVAQQRHVESDPVVASGLLTPTNPNQLSRTVSSAESCAAATGNAFSKESSPAIDPRFHQNGPNIPAATPSPLGYQNYCFNNHYQHEQQQQQQKNTSLSTSVSLDNHHFNHDINTTGATLCPPSSPEMSSPSAPLPAGPVAAAKRRLPIFSRLSSSSQQPASTRVGI